MTLDEVVAVIVESGVIAGVEGFDSDKTFEANGIDSLDTYTILLALEEKTGLELEGVPLEEINSAKTVHAYIVSNFT